MRNMESANETDTANASDNAMSTDEAFLQWMSMDDLEDGEEGPVDLSDSEGPVDMVSGSNYSASRISDVAFVGSTYEEWCYTRQDELSTPSDFEQWVATYSDAENALLLRRHAISQFFVGHAEMRRLRLALARVLRPHSLAAAAA